jgi:hypothetical protein
VLVGWRPWVGPKAHPWELLARGATRQVAGVAARPASELDASEPHVGVSAASGAVQSELRAHFTSLHLGD